ncbi:UPF0488 protein C8orf33 homolog [Engystomops pustulosus]|uniref:UPF0488 protein C8orf33 homolog n=1 Tax=Engystomops pustulosus TaxID=76066 RepID=UPI003AFADDF8
MEEAPKGTFEDELEWCINQLETGLLRRNPTPRQVTDTQRVLRVLRSRKAPFVKKRQVMNQVFGNYRLKMAEERRVQEQAAKKPPEPQIQEVTTRDAQSVAYRKSTKEVQSGTGHWFTPSSSEFAFNFFPNQQHQGNLEDGLEDQATEGQCTESPASQQHNALCLEGPSQFTFNFLITEEACTSSGSSVTPLTTQDAVGDHNMAPLASQENKSQNCANSDTTIGTSRVTANKTGKTEDKSTADPPKKKKKSKSKNMADQTQSKADECKRNVDPVPPPKEELKSGPEELRRELDWCVEQLEIGLQRQKSTPKQVEEALRAIKTLRGEKVPLVKKRQVMRLMFGDYRHKMEEERVKQLRLMQNAAKSAKMTEVTLTTRQNSSKVFRKSIHKSANSVAAKFAAPSDPQGTSDHNVTASSSSQQEFIFRPSQEAFCFNFFS